MRNILDDQQATWRDNWFVKNVFSEIPVLGGLFGQAQPGTAQLAFAAHHAMKSSFMLLGGVVVMMLNLMQIHESDGAGEKFGKMMGGMAIGMTAGSVLYNTLFSLGKQSIDAAKKCCPPGKKEGENQQLLPVEFSF